MWEKEKITIHNEHAAKKKHQIVNEWQNLCMKKYKETITTMNLAYPNEIEIEPQSIFVEITCDFFSLTLSSCALSWRIEGVNREQQITITHFIDVANKNKYEHKRDIIRKVLVCCTWNARTWKKGKDSQEKSSVI